MSLELSQNIAREIVDELSKVTLLNINIMDTAGSIIASRDKTRIGSYHEGAHRVVTHELDQLIITEKDNLRGALPGLNYPIVMQGKIAGVLGITGEYEKIVDSARIIKRMTELYLQNAYITEQKHFDKNIRNRYFDEWVNGDVKNITNEFVERGRALGFDITIPRQFMVCSVYSTAQESGIKNIKRIENAEDSIVQYVTSLDSNNLVFKSGVLLVLAVSETSNEGLYHIAQQLVSVVENKFELKLAVGIDASVENYTNAKNSYMRARIANQACMRTHKWDVRFYHDLRMELLVDNVNDTTKLEFIHSLFSDFTQEEVIDSIILLEHFYETDGSILRTAERLYLHKNTLQYRLKKIAERTGYDPRSIRHSSLFYIAISFYRDLSQRGLLAKF